MDKKKTLRSLSREYASQEQFSELLEEAKNSSDRSASILFACYIEVELAELIKMNLSRRDERDAIAPLYERDGALSTFYSSIHLAFAMGLIDNSEVKMLNVIRRIRNAFAHTALSIDFQTDEVAKEIRSLPTWKATDETIEASRKDWHDNKAEVSRERIVYTIYCVSALTLVLVKMVRHLRRLEKKLLTASDRASAPAPANPAPSR